MFWWEGQRPDLRIDLCSLDPWSHSFALGNCPASLRGARRGDCSRTADVLARSGVD